MSSNINLKYLLHEVLGYYIPKSKNNYSFKCPFCNHYKHKLEVSLTNYNWHCWVCHAKGKSIYTLIKSIELPQTSKQDYISRLSKLIPNEKYDYDKLNSAADLFSDKEEYIQYCELPNEFIPLYKKDNTLEYKLCVEYLLSRGVTYNDILKYNIGYCVEGLYSTMIIFPNYNKDGKLNFFTTRSYRRNSDIKFINPPISRDIVGFELQVNPKLPIILVESALDAIILKNNAIPLYGTILLPNLKKWIINNKVKEIYICLDNDALNNSINIIEYFTSLGILVKFIKLNTSEDPNELGYKKMQNLIKTNVIEVEDDCFELKVKSLF